MTASPRVSGFCLMGCGQTLYLDLETEAVTCSNGDCPAPVAVDLLLEDAETEHIVYLELGGYSVRHPLRERINDGLVRCDLHTWLAERSGPPMLPGNYRVTWQNREQPGTWERLP